MAQQEPNRRILGQNRDLDSREPAQVMSPRREQELANQILWCAAGDHRYGERGGIRNIVEYQQRT